MYQAEPGLAALSQCHGPLHDRMTLFAEIHGYQNVRVGHAALLGSGLGMARLVQFGEQFFLTGQYVL